MVEVSGSVRDGFGAVKDAFARNFTEHGDVGASAAVVIDGELVVNPTLAEIEESSRLDLVVVGTKAALTMVEAGASVVPEETILEAFARFEMPDDLIEGWGFPEVTEQTKRKILGGNIARLHGFDAGEDFSRVYRFAHDIVGARLEQRQRRFERRLIPKRDDRCP